MNVIILCELNCISKSTLDFYAAHLSYRNSVHLSVRLSHGWISQKTVQARITKSSPSAARKTLVSGTVKPFHKFEGGHPNEAVGAEFNDLQ